MVVEEFIQAFVEGIDVVLEVAVSEICGVPACNGMTAYISASDHVCRSLRPIMHILRSASVQQHNLCCAGPLAPSKLIHDVDDADCILDKYRPGGAPAQIHTE